MSVPAWKQRQLEKEAEAKRAKEEEEQLRRAKLAELGLATTTAPASTPAAAPANTCSKCNKAVEPSHRFCTHCGAPFEPASTTTTTSSTSSTSAATQPPRKAAVPVVAQPSTPPRPLPSAPDASLVSPRRAPPPTPTAPAAPLNKGASMPAVPLPARRAQPTPPAAAARSAAPPTSVAAAATRSVVVPVVAAADSEAQRRAKKQIVQLRKLGDSKLTKKRVFGFPPGKIELEAIAPRGTLTAGDSIAVGVLVNNASALDVLGVRVRLEQLTLVATSPTSHALHESVTWRTFHDQTRVPANSQADIVVQCLVPKHTPPSGSRQAADSSIGGQPAWFTYKLTVTTDAAWISNPTVSFDVDVRAHPQAPTTIQAGKAPLGAALPDDATPAAATAAAAASRTRLTHSRRAEPVSGRVATSLSFCVGCGDRSLARICARCFVSGRAATFCAGCGAGFVDSGGNELDCTKCGEPRGVLPAATTPAVESARVPVPLRKAGTQIYPPRAPAVAPVAAARAASPPPTPTPSHDVLDAPLSPRGVTISAPTGVQKNPEAVRAMLAAAGVDPSLVAPNRPAGVAAVPSSPSSGTTMFNFSKPIGFQRNPDAVKALLEAAGVDAASVLSPPSAAPPAAPRPVVPPNKQLPQLPAAARAAAPPASTAAAATRPTHCMLCHTRKVAARVARHGKEMFLCRECTLEQREKFKARGTINIGASPMRKGPLPPSEPKPAAAAPRPANNQYVALELIPAPTAEQLERERQLDGGGGGDVELSGIDVIGQCTVMYDFVSEHESELGLRAGDVVQITCRVDDEWLEGFIDDGSGVRAGLFPIAYIREHARQ